MFGNNFWKDNGKIISMQYEQILRKSERRSHHHDPKGQAVTACHLAWGNAQKDIYIKNGIENRRIAVCGHIAMDLLQPSFDSAYYSREEIAEKFDLDYKKKWVLFISTFAYKMMTDKEREAFKSIDPGTSVQIGLSLEAQRRIIQWLSKLSDERENVIVIYRKHPAERIDPDIMKLANSKCGRFRYIDDLSMRQWVRVTDRMYTWYSTSIADPYFRKKMCWIIRPVDLPDDNEIEIMSGANKVFTYDEFIQTIDMNTEEMVFPISDEIMEYYYGKTADDGEDYSFLKIADVCERVFLGKEFYHRYRYFEKDMKFNALYKGIIGGFYGIMFEIARNFNFKIPLRLRQKKYFKSLSKYVAEGYHIDKEINEKKKMYFTIVETIHKSKGDYIYRNGK